MHADPTPDLVTRAQRGDVAAREALARAWLRRVHGMALAVSRSRDEADDATQDAFVRAFERLHTLRRPERFGSWLLTLTRRVALDRLRAGRRRGALHAAARASVGAAHAGAVGDLADAFTGASDGDAVRRAWAALPERERAVVLWSVVDGATLRDIASWLGTNKSRIDRMRRGALEHMRKELES
ncbi:MAG: RNA polymerase sigma factor [Planctomycetota bacterium]